MVKTMWGDRVTDTRPQKTSRVPSPSSLSPTISDPTQEHTLSSQALNKSPEIVYKFFIRNDRSSTKVPCMQRSPFVLPKVPRPLQRVLGLPWLPRFLQWASRPSNTRSTNDQPFRFRWLRPTDSSCWLRPANKLFKPPGPWPRHRLVRSSLQAPPRCFGPTNGLRE